MNFFVYYKELSDIESLRFNLKDSLNDLNISYTELTLNIFTDKFSINFLSEESNKKVNTGIIFYTSKTNAEEILEVILNSLKHFFIAEKYYLVSSHFDWLNWDGKIEEKMLTASEVECYKYNYEVFSSKERLKNYLEDVLEFSIDTKIEEIKQLKQLKNKLKEF